MKALRDTETQERREGRAEGTKALRDTGTQGRREGRAEGTRARRHEGTQERRDEGPKARMNVRTRGRSAEGTMAEGTKR